MDLTKKEVEISLIMNMPVFKRFEIDFRDETAQIMEQENNSVFLLEEEKIKTPAVIAASDKVMFLGLFDRNGRFDRQYIMSFEPGAIKWGEELFENYMKMASEIKNL